jgi:hypothetical protein
MTELTNDKDEMNRHYYTSGRNWGFFQGIIFGIAMFVCLFWLSLMIFHLKFMPVPENYRCFWDSHVQDVIIVCMPRSTKL